MLAINLTQYQFLRVSGSDAVQFLQGQLTCNMDELSSQRSLRGALCNLKGRVIADFRVVQQGTDCLLQTGTGMAELILATLSKYAVFHQIELSIETQPNHPLGLIGDESGPLLREIFGDLPAEHNQVVQSATISLIRINGITERYEIWFHDDSAANELLSQLDSPTPGKLDDWNREDIRAGILHVDPGLSETLTPQLLNYDLSGIIDFNKGCYTGQEVVARMHFRSTAKKRLFLASSNTPISANSLAIRADAKDAKAAQIIAYHNPADAVAGPSLLLTILNTGDVDDGVKFTLSDQPQSSLKILSLPYTN